MALKPLICIFFVKISKKYTFFALFGMRIALYMIEFAFNVNAVTLRRTIIILGVELIWLN